MRKLEIAAGLVASLLMLLPATGFSESEYYTWIDENGVTNYSERNPQGYNAQHVSNQSRFGFRSGALGNEPKEPTSVASEEPQSQSAADDADIDQHIASERARIDQEIATAKKGNCAIGKKNLAQLEAYARIRVKDDDGQERVLNDKEKASRISKAKQTIRENCTG